MSNTSKLLQLFYEKDGNFKEAYYYANMHKLASDSLTANEAKEQVLKLMFDHKVNLKDLERKQLLDKEQHEKRKSIFNLYSVILLLIIIMLMGALVLFRTMQQRKIDRIKKEKADLQVITVEKDIELRNREIVEKVLKISEKNELIDATVKLLDEFSANLSQKQKAELEIITRELRMKGTKNQWEEFFWYFSQVYSQFYEKLEKEFPGLTLNEKRLCALLKLNMTTKDVAIITNLNFKSIEVARTRLRKKLNLTNSNLTLQEFFSQYN
jgi:DNA-binding CsgD family transcriptional regulator